MVQFELKHGIYWVSYYVPLSASRLVLLTFILFFLHKLGAVSKHLVWEQSMEKKKAAFWEKWKHALKGGGTVYLMRWSLQMWV